MSTTDNTEFDYEGFSQSHAPRPDQVRRGQGARRARRAAAKQRITIRLDDDIVEQFKELAPDGRGYQALMNRALRDWLAARGVKELLRSELRDLLAESLVHASEASNQDSTPPEHNPTGTEQADGD